MNYLAHFKLAGGHPKLLVGNILADHIKGKLVGQFEKEIESGIHLHRVIDAYTDSHPLVRASHAKFHPKYRRYGGIITDIVFDHFLALNWSYYDSRSLQVFCRDTMNEVICHTEIQLSPAKEQMERMRKKRLMEKYVDTAFIKRSLTYLSKKLKKENPLTSGHSQFEIFKLELERDFLLFSPELQDFADSWIQEHYHPN